jgi:hypothetical protein
MGNLVKVTYYPLLRNNQDVIDLLVQPEVSVIWEPALVDIQQSNIQGLMSLANITPSAWRKHLIDHFGFDVMSPTPEGLRRVGVAAERIGRAMQMASDQKENWELEGDIDDLWTWDGDYHPNLTPAQVYEILAETGARGTPVISFQVDEASLREALAEDNTITLKGEDSVYVGLSDPINGYNWSPEGLKTEVSFRPAARGVVVIGDDHLWENVIDSAYEASLEFEPAPEVLLSSRSTATSRLKPPEVREFTQSKATTYGGPRL